MSKSRILNVANMSFNAFRENKVIAKISKFTVYTHYHQNEKGIKKDQNE